MLEEKKISVIVPVYNVENYLEKCIDSILTQTYKNTEILIIDDGSTDNSGEICDRLSEKDERITVLHKPNGGLSDARNAGLELATGDYISFVDSDDYLEPDFLKILAESLERTGADVSACRYRMVWENGDSKSIGNDGKTVEYTGDGPLAEYLYGVNVDPFVWNKLYKREIIGSTIFIKGITGEDNPFNIEIMKRCNKLVSTGADLYCYLQNRKGSILSSGISQKKIDMVFRWNEVTEDCRNNYPQLVKYSLRRQFLFYAGLYNRIWNNSGFREAQNNIRSFIKSNYREILRSDVCSKTEKTAALLLAKTPHLYVGIMQIYKKVTKSN